MSNTEKKTAALWLALNSAAHLLVDAVCAATVFGAAVRGNAQFATLIFVYNTLAFSTQCLVGLAADRIKRHPLCASIAELAVVCGFALPLPAIMKIILIGCGNSVFHVAGGAMTLEASEKKAAPLGVFVAPGAVGLTLGTMFPSIGGYFAAALAAAAVLSLVLSVRLAPKIGNGKAGSHDPKAPDGDGIAVALLLTFAVAVRAIGGNAVRFTWQTTQLTALLLTAFVFAGKALGGFVCDRLGARRSALISVPAAAVLIAFFSSFAVPSLVGQLALNLTMPVTLFLMYRAMPSQPGFAFGLAAAALWPGTIAGKLFILTGPALGALVLLSFLFGLFAILYSEKRLQKALEG